MMARNKDLLKEHDVETPMLLLAHHFHTNHSTFSIPYSIALVLQDNEDVFPKDLPK